MLDDIRVRFLILCVILAAGLIVFMKRETNRVNQITDEYLDIYGRNMWLIGCAQGTGNFDQCKVLGQMVDFGKLIPEVKKVSQ